MSACHCSWIRVCIPSKHVGRSIHPYRSAHGGTRCAMQVMGIDALTYVKNSSIISKLHATKLQKRFGFRFYLIDVEVRYTFENGRTPQENFSQIDVRLKMGVEQCDFHSRREYPPVTNGFSRTTHEKFISKYISFKVV